MTRRQKLLPEFVEFIPDRLAPGTLYISRRYSTATHLCCCGCGLEVVTPLNPAKWRLEEQGGIVSLRPSVGNWSLPCQSHYWITNNQVRWAGRMSPDAIAKVKRRDRKDADILAQQQLGYFAILRRRLKDAWQAAWTFVTGLWR